MANIPYPQQYDDSFMNIFKRIIDELNSMGYTYEESLQKAQDILEKAQQTNDMNESVQQQINTMIAESGTSDAEVLQARFDSEGNEYDVLKTRLDEKEQNFNSQLAQNTDYVRAVDESKNRELISKRNRKPMITIIDDDGRNHVVSKWEPILQSKDFKLDIAVITGWVGNSGYLPWSELERLKDTYKVDLVNHTHTHPHMGQLTEQEVIEQFQNSTKILQQRGHTWDIMVYPYGSQNDTVRQVAREYVRAGIDILGGVATPPLETFKINRQSLIPGSGSMDSVESYTQYIDEAIEKNGWIIFMSHSQYEGFDADKIKAIIDYANSKDIEWVHAKEGLDRMGNLIDVGDYVNRSQGAEYTVLDADGVMHSRANSLDYSISRNTDVVADTPITHFPERKTTVNIVMSNSNAGFPELSGIVETHRGSSDSFSYQIFRHASSNRMYKRYWNNGESRWNSFERIDAIRLKEQFTHQISGEIPAGGYITETFTHEGISNNDNIIGTPRAGIEAGLFFNVMISGTDSVRVRIFNPTDTDRSTNRTWKFDIIKP